MVGERATYGSRRSAIVECHGYGGWLDCKQGGCVEAELMALAAAGATAFVQQMATDSWAQARDRIALFFARRDGGEGVAIEGELETSRGELTAALEAGDEQMVLDVEAGWRTRLRRTLMANPHAASELQSVLDELAPRRGGQQFADVHNTISGGVQHGSVVQAGSVGSLSFGTPPEGGWGSTQV